MGLFDLFSDVKDNMDRSKEAREFLRQAKELTKEGEAIYDRAYDKVSSYASETEYKLRRHMDYKKTIAKELNSGSIAVTLRDFKQFNIDKKIISMPTIKDVTIKESNVGLGGLSHAVSSLDVRAELPSILDMFISDDDYYEARRAKDEAKRFKERMKMEREELYSCKEKMAEICSFIIEEKDELDALMNKIKKITSELEDAMKQNSFTEQQAIYLKSIHQIAECVAALLSEDFLSDTLNIKQRYMNIFNEIKNINQNLPYAPSISDSVTLAQLKRIADGGVRW